MLDLSTSLPTEENVVGALWLSLDCRDVFAPFRLVSCGLTLAAYFPKRSQKFLVMSY